MPLIVRAIIRRAALCPPLLRLMVLAVVLIALSGCATSEADLNYTRDKPVDESSDHSYHGWNSSNY